MDCVDEDTRKRSTVRGFTKSRLVWNFETALWSTGFWLRRRAANLDDILSIDNHDAHIKHTIDATSTTRDNTEQENWQRNKSKCTAICFIQLTYEWNQSHVVECLLLNVDALATSSTSGRCVLWRSYPLDGQPRVCRSNDHYMYYTVYQWTYLCIMHHSQWSRYSMAKNRHWHWHNFRARRK